MHLKSRFLRNNTSWDYSIFSNLVKIFLWLCIVVSISTCEGSIDEEMNDLKDKTEAAGIYLLENKSIKHFSKITYEELRIFCHHGKHWIPYLEKQFLFTFAKYIFLINSILKYHFFNIKVKRYQLVHFGVLLKWDFK